MNYQKITLFLLLAFTLSVLGWYVPGWLMEGDSLFLPFLRLMAYSWGPGLAALAVQRGLYGQSMRGYGWNRKYFSLRWIGSAVALPWSSAGMRPTAACEVSAVRVTKVREASLRRRVVASP